MEYTSILQPLTLVGVTFMMGALVGAFWMFNMMYKTQNHLKEELDAKTMQLNSYLNKYENDDYEAY